MGWTKGLELAKVARRDGQHFDCATWLHKAREMPKEDFRREVEKELTGKETEPSELIYFKIYKSQIPVIEKAIETAALMLGSDKSCGYCLEMVCADFLAGAHMENGNPEILLNSISRYYRFLPARQKQAFVEEVVAKASMSKRSRIELDPEAYRRLQCQVLERDAWRCQVCGSMTGLQVHHLRFRSQAGDDDEQNLIAVCQSCHEKMHASGNPSAVAAYDG